MPSSKEYEVLTVSTKEFDQESQLQFVDVEKPDTAAWLGKVRNRRVLAGLVCACVFMLILGTVLGLLPCRGACDSSQGVGSRRLVAVLREGEGCPSAEQVAASTHIVLPPVSVSTDSAGCSVDCALSYAGPTCDVRGWQGSGKKVLLSFGGQGWQGCWDRCYGRQAQVATQLAALHKTHDLDGVAFISDHSPAASELAAMEAFYVGVTEEVRSVVPANALVGHIGHDTHLVEGTWYHNAMRRASGVTDFLVAQYFDGLTRPGLEGLGGGVYASAMVHYTELVETCFNGDSTKVVFGLCISSCSASNSNTDAQAAVSLMQQLQTRYTCNGGISYWAGDDADGSWGTSVKGVMEEAGPCTAEAPAVSVPAVAPAPTGSVTDAPGSAAPSTATPPTPPTPVPTPLTPVPTKAIPGCYYVIPMYGYCINDPHCCQEGTRCYQEAPFKATCLATCNYPPKCKLIGN
eukprot:TRINITY_DN37711_c0_g1_i1.p1 TRINITY_DN37711_c0_g1~~TRINITY_DN37711_c0_g1_i1.p1  ORF type:complete len:461 (+),score=112.81 TRINITY_DN37711_c0_g1_i1:47-1429(+)